MVEIYVSLSSIFQKSQTTGMVLPSHFCWARWRSHKKKKTWGFCFPRDPGSPSENGFMEPKHLAFWKWSYTPCSSSDKLIGSLGFRVHVERVPKLGIFRDWAQPGRSSDQPKGPWLVMCWKKGDEIQPRSTQLYQHHLRGAGLWPLGGWWSWAIIYHSFSTP